MQKGLFATFALLLSFALPVFADSSPPAVSIVSELRSKYDNALGFRACDRQVLVVSPTVSFSNGVYANTWHSHASALNGTGCREDDYALGWAGEIAPKLTFDASLTYLDLRGTDDLRLVTTLFSYAFTDEISAFMKGEYYQTNSRSEELRAGIVGATYAKSFGEWNFAATATYHSTSYSDHSGLNLKFGRKVGKDVEASVGYQSYNGGFRAESYFTRLNFAF